MNGSKAFVSAVVKATEALSVASLSPLGCRMVLAESKSALFRFAHRRGHWRVFIQNASQNLDIVERGGI
jgi:hypothetical protein